MPASTLVNPPRQNQQQQAGAAPRSNSQSQNGQGGGVANGGNNGGNRFELPSLEQRIEAANAIVSDREKRQQRQIFEFVRPRTAEILPAFMAGQLGLSPDILKSKTDLEPTNRMASYLKDKQTTLTGLLEILDPNEWYMGTAFEHTDAYERQLIASNIRTSPVHEKGQYSHKVERFFQSNVPGSQVLFPEFINRIMRQPRIAPDILQYIIGTTTGITGDTYRTIYAADADTDRRMYRVEQGAEISKTVLKTSEQVIKLYKYGRLLEGTYEYFRRVTIDLFAILLSRMALQANLDKASAAVDVAINGDGNSNAATNFNQTTLDSGSSAGTMTYRAFINFALQFFPYSLTTLVGSATSIVNFLSMSRPSIDPFQVLAMLEQNQMVTQEVRLPQGIYTNVQLVYLPSPAMPDGVLLGLDKNSCLEYVVEEGAQLVETDRLISSQRNQVAISEVVGFAKMFSPSAKTWTWTA